METNEINQILDRVYAEGRGSMKIEILNLIHKFRMLPKEKVTITFIEEEIKKL